MTTKKNVKLSPKHRPAESSALSLALVKAITDFGGGRVGDGLMTLGIGLTPYVASFAVEKFGIYKPKAKE